MFAWFGSGVNAEAAMCDGVAGSTARLGSLSSLTSELMKLGIMLTTVTCCAATGTAGTAARRRSARERKDFISILRAGLSEEEPADAVELVLGEDVERIHDDQGVGRHVAVDGRLQQEDRRLARRELRRRPPEMVGVLGEIDARDRVSLERGVDRESGEDPGGGVLARLLVPAHRPHLADLSGNDRDGARQAYGQRFVGLELAHRGDVLAQRVEDRGLRDARRIGVARDLA